MTAIVWPVSVPTKGLIDGYDESDMDIVAEFKPDVGDSLRSRRASEDVEEVSFKTIMTFTQYTTLKTFRRTTLKSGTLPFQRAHPRTGVSTTAIFLELGSPEVVNATMCTVTMRMRLTVD